MTKQELLEEWRELMQRDEILLESDLLDQMEEWDSLSQLVLTAFFDRKLKKHISVASLANCRTVQDLLDLALK